MINYIGRRLAEARRAKNITQETFSDLTGISVSEISRIENGRNSTSLETLLKFCDVLEIGPDVLLYDYLPKNTEIKNPDIQHAVSLMETMNERDAKFILNLIIMFKSRIQD